VRVDDWIGDPPVGRAWNPAAELRGDEDAVRRLWRSPGSRTVLFDGDKVAVDADGRVIWIRGQPAGPPETWAFLGLDDRGCARFAAAVQREDVAEAADWRSPRRVAAADMGELLAAAALMNWHGANSRCPRCGHRSTLVDSGWKRHCPHDGNEIFPRLDPVVIMLVHDGGDRALLGRRVGWPQGWFSTLAGFVEPGESLEHAVAREVGEEVGLQVRRTRYLASQPWPFPYSLMIGFHAEAAGDLRPDGEEIEEAIWVQRSDLLDACESGRILLPPELSISHWLIQEWFGAALPGGWSR
jgi:NAD+ diphosphatase